MENKMARKIHNKLTSQNILEAIYLVGRGKSYKEIAKHLNVENSTISMTVCGNIHRKITKLEKSSDNRKNIVDGYIIIEKKTDGTFARKMNDPELVKKNETINSANSTPTAAAPINRQLNFNSDNNKTMYLDIVVTINGKLVSDNFVNKIVELISEQ